MARVKKRCFWIFPGGSVEAAAWDIARNPLGKSSWCGDIRLANARAGDYHAEIEIPRTGAAAPGARGVLFRGDIA